jgi:GDP-mannose 6-dehydrogenase
LQYRDRRYGLWKRRVSMRISTFGLGYIGTATAACLAQQGHQVIGVDVNLQKVEFINGGRSPVIEQDLDETVAQVVSTGSLRATSDAPDAVLNSDLSLVCVGAPTARARE